jgi:hypothetical protein
MASTDALPIPRKNVAFRVTFPILDNDGDLVTGAAGLDSEISKDGGTFSDCTNEATEIATSSGMYYLDLTSTEMNADTVAIIVKTSTTNAKTTTIVIYPAEDAELRASVRDFGGTAGTFASGRPEVNTTHLAGSALNTSAAQLGVNVVNWKGSAPADLSSTYVQAHVASQDSAVLSAIQNGLGTEANQTSIANSISTLTNTIGTPTDFGSGTSTIAANLQDIADNGTATFDRSTDSLQALRDHIADGTNLTEAGGTGDHLTALALSTAGNTAIRDSVVAIFTDDVGTAQAGAAGTITLRSGAVATDDYYNGAYVTLTGGTGVGQTRKITDYVGSTKVATLDSNWVTNPDNTSTYIILGRAV